MNGGAEEGTAKVKAPAFTLAGRAWREFRYSGLEKVSKTQVLLFHRLEWLLPGVGANGRITEAVQARLKQLFDEEVRMGIDYIHVVPPKQLRRYVGHPTFLAVIAPLPHKTRGFLEVELGLAHAVIDMLLGGAGETLSLRPLTDIEEGVMSYVLLETLKALAPGLEPGLPRLRLEGLCHGIDEALGLLGEESQVAVVMLKCIIGTQSGYLRLFIPASVLGMTTPPPQGPEQRTHRVGLLHEKLGRLSGVRTALRAEVGWAQIALADLASLQVGDVVLIDELSARPDLGEGGRAELYLGSGKTGRIDAEVLVEDGRYLAKIERFAASVSKAPPLEESPTAEPSSNPEVEPGSEGARQPVEASPPEDIQSAELLNDIPLQIAVELARVPISAEEVVSLKIGQVIDLNKVTGEPVELSVNGKVVGRGELVEVEGHLGVRILSLS